jgi:hypothetical protein
LITNGPLPSLSRSAQDKHPEKGKPWPLSSIANRQWPVLNVTPAELGLRKQSQNQLTALPTDGRGPNTLYRHCPCRAPNSHLHRNQYSKVNETKRIRTKSAKSRFMRLPRLLSLLRSTARAQIRSTLTWRITDGLLRLRLRGCARGSDCSSERQRTYVAYGGPQVNRRQ